jgi:hypothetical protein
LGVFAIAWLRATRMVARARHVGEGGNARAVPPSVATRNHRAPANPIVSGDDAAKVVRSPPCRVSTNWATYGFRADDGLTPLTERWRTVVPGDVANVFRCNPAANSVYVSDGWGGTSYAALALHRLSLKSGERLATVRTRHQGVCSMVIHQNRLLVATDKRLLELDGSDLSTRRAWDRRLVHHAHELVWEVTQPSHRARAITTRATRDAHPPLLLLARESTSHDCRPNAQAPTPPAAPPHPHAPTPTAPPARSAGRTERTPLLGSIPIARFGLYSCARVA